MKLRKMERKRTFDEDSILWEKTRRKILSLFGFSDSDNVKKIVLKLECYYEG